jgi:hypothetical protein
LVHINIPRRVLSDTPRRAKLDIRTNLAPTFGEG